MLRQGRRMAHWALDAMGVSRMEDVVVPRSRVPDLLRAIHEIGERQGLRIGVFGHAGDGNLHPSFVFDREDPTGAGPPPRGPGRPLPGHAGARRLGDGRARDRGGQEGLARADPRRRTPCA